MAFYSHRTKKVINQGNLKKILVGTSERPLQQDGGIAPLAAELSGNILSFGAGGS